MYKLSKLLLAFGVAMAIFSAQIVSASPFQNGDFSSGFSGWKGQLDDGFGTSLIVDPATDSHFNLDSQGSAISYSDVFDPFWIISLYQNFQMEALLSPDHSLKMSFWMQWSSPNDLLSATIGTIDLLQDINLDALLLGNSFEVDVTSLAGLDLELCFTIGDLDFIAPDILKISNISFRQEGSQAAPIPEPASLLLLGSGLVSLSFIRRR